MQKTKMQRVTEEKRKRKGRRDRGRGRKGRGEKPEHPEVKAETQGERNSHTLVISLC